jgi:hypothetical protein
MSYANTHRESPRHSAAEGDHYYNDDLYDAYTNAGQSSTSENPGYASQHYEDSSYYTAHDGEQSVSSSSLFRYPHYFP